MTETHTDEYLAQFGSGLCYSLALFLAHEANFKYVIAEIEVMSAEGAFDFQGKHATDSHHIRETLDRLAALRWLSAASMPIRNLQIPATLPNALQSRLAEFKSKCVQLTFPASAARGPTRADVAWLIDEAKALLRLVDEHHGVPTVAENPSVTARREPNLHFT